MRTVAAAATEHDAPTITMLTGMPTHLSKAHTTVDAVRHLWHGRSHGEVNYRIKVCARLRGCCHGVER